MPVSAQYVHAHVCLHACVRTHTFVCICEHACVCSCMHTFVPALLGIVPIVTCQLLLHAEEYTQGWLWLSLAPCSRRRAGVRKGFPPEPKTWASFIRDRADQAKRLWEEHVGAGQWHRETPSSWAQPSSASHWHPRPCLCHGYLGQDQP